METVENWSSEPNKIQLKMKKGEMEVVRIKKD